VATHGAANAPRALIWTWDGRGEIPGWRARFGGSLGVLARRYGCKSRRTTPRSPEGRFLGKGAHRGDPTPGTPRRRPRGLKGVDKPAAWWPSHVTGAVGAGRSRERRQARIFVRWKASRFTSPIRSVHAGWSAASLADLRGGKGAQATGPPWGWATGASEARSARIGTGRQRPPDTRATRRSESSAVEQSVSSRARARKRVTRPEASEARVPIRGE